MLDWLWQRIQRKRPSAVGMTDQGPVHSVANTDALPGILSVWQARLSEYDRKISESFGLPATDITSMPAADLLGQLIMIRLIRAAERQGHNPFSDDDHRLPILAVLSACALQAGAAASVTLARDAPSVKITPEALRDAVLTFAAVHGSAQDAAWRATFSEAVVRAGGELQRAASATGGPEADFAKLLTSLGILEAQTFAAGSEQERKLDRLADVIVRVSGHQPA